MSDKNVVVDPVVAVYMTSFIVVGRGVCLHDPCSIRERLRASVGAGCFGSFIAVGNHPSTGAWMGGRQGREKGVSVKEWGLLLV